ncbi:hypothetical protein BDW02DRAFT_244047 [Decorospora gaudefroyi]|uniref:Uncharacterized protein n=1 Tax=Decorospora gaudefroyi TaxID=184978 RepID=A0A6A5KLW8_9PLEO|nr:hypothetical protein BDW02DRAFT_244047 [Decorospora gaudefroyi]
MLLGPLLAISADSTPQTFSLVYPRLNIQTKVWRVRGRVIHSLRFRSFSVYRLSFNVVFSRFHDSCGFAHDGGYNFSEVERRPAVEGAEGWRFLGLLIRWVWWLFDRVVELAVRYQYLELSNLDIPAVLCFTACKRSNRASQSTLNVFDRRDSTAIPHCRGDKAV